MKKKVKALVLFSGGLDSILAVKLLQEQGIETELVSFLNPFSSEKHDVEEIARKLNSKLHKMPLGNDYIEVIRNPMHGYGSRLNPCIDCKIYMYRQAKKLASRIKADFIATGEVLGERPFSQTRDKLMLIEREAGLEGKVLRPLSAKLLPPTEAEKRGIVERHRLLDIQGRRRARQMHIAKRFGIKEYPSPAGGCLLTDRHFSVRLKDLFENQKKITLDDIEILKVGRHFRIGESKIVIGRNEKENKKLMEIASKKKFSWMEVDAYPGPVTIVIDPNEHSIDVAAALTVYYSDAPRKHSKVMLYSGKETRTIRAERFDISELKKNMLL